MALVALITVVALAATGCGGSSAPPTPKEPERVTTAAEVAAMKKRLAEDEELRPRYKQEASECKAVVSEYEWGRQCLEPLAENLARLTVLDDRLADELMHKAGQGCLEALRAGLISDPIEPKTIAACERDIGKRPDETG